jgi:hypothetical protein
MNNDAKQLARDIYLQALSTAANLAGLTQEERIQMLREVATICIDAADVFYETISDCES